MHLGVIRTRFLRADVNLHLMALVLVVLIAFVSFSVYYQSRIRGMQIEYGKKFDNLKDIETRLHFEEERLNEISELKNNMEKGKHSAEKDNEALAMGFVTLRNENKNLRTEKTSLIEEFYTRPFGKAKCKTTGDVKCLDSMQ